MGGGYTPGRVHALTLARGQAVPLDASLPLALRVTQHYRIIEASGARGPWKAQTVAYWYAVEDRVESEVLSYHWHPAGRSAVTTPHLHLGPASEVGLEPLRGSHLPSGRVALEDVIRLAIMEFGVRERRDDWSDVLDATQAAYEAWRTWPSPRASE